MQGGGIRLWNKPKNDLNNSEYSLELNTEADLGLVWFSPNRLRGDNIALKKGKHFLE